MQGQSIRWLRVLLIGIAAEFGLMLVVAPLYLIGGQEAVNLGVAPATLVVFIPFGIWVARPLKDRFVLHGVLMGAAAVVFYNVMNFGATSVPGAPPLNVAQLFSPLYLLSHVFKLVGGGIGGWLASRRRQPA
ncbi:MAG: hypothetical protein J7485_05690 [Sphingobium sp.]|nr:hypothetical protein [Sphingobium sp.]